MKDSLHTELVAIENLVKALQEDIVFIEQETARASKRAAMIHDLVYPLKAAVAAQRDAIKSEPKTN